jgi:hypothetical protein
MRQGERKEEAEREQSGMQSYTFWGHLCRQEWR